MTKKMQQNLILLLLMLVGILFVYYKYLLSPLQDKYKEGVRKLQAAETKLNDTRRRALELPRLQAEMKQLELEVSMLEKLLPKDKEIPDLLRMVTKTAQHYQLKIMNFTPSKLAAQPNYNEVPFQVTLQGTYHALGYFLADLGQESRMLNARNINLSAAQGSKESPTTINANFMLVAYTFKN